MADINLDIDLQALRRELDAVKKSLADIEAAGGKAFKPPKGISEQVDQINRLEAEYKQLESAAKTLEGALRRATDPKAIKEYSAELAKLRSAQKGVEESAGKLGANLKATNRELGLGKQVVSEFFAAFSVTAAIAGVAALAGKAIELAKNYEVAQKQITALLGSADKANKVLAEFEKLAGTTILDTGEVIKTGKALLAFGESTETVTDTLRKIGDISAATGKDFNELGLIYGKARTAGVLYAEDINQLVEAGIPVVEQFAKQLGVSTDQVKKLASEGKIGFTELELAFTNFTAAGGKFYGQLDAQAQTLAGRQANLNSEWEKFLRQAGELLLPILEKIVGYFNNIVGGLSKAFDNTASWEQRLKGIINAVVPITGYLDGIITKTRELVGLETKKNDALDAGREKYEAEKDSRNEIAALEQKAEKDREKLAAESRKKEAEKRAKERKQIEAELNRLKIEALKDGIDKEIAIENLRFQTLIKELRKYGLDTAQATEQHEKNVRDIRTKYAVQEILQRQKEQEELLKQEQAYLDELKSLTDRDTEEAKKRREAAQATSGRVAEIEAANFEKLQLLQRRFFFEKKRSAQEVEQFEKDQAKARELFQLEQQAQELERIIRFGDELSDAEKSVLEKRIANIREQAEQIKAGIGEQDGKDDPKKSLLAQILGLDEENAKAVEDAISQTIASISQAIDTAIAEADARLQTATGRVEEARSLLEEEQELQKQGFANNVELRQKELDDAKRAQAQALEDKKRAQRLALAIDASVQASNIAVSVSNIIRNFSQIPFVGVLLGIAQVASLFAFITSTRARARAISNQQFRHGGSAEIRKDGFIVGPSHESGGVPIEVEGGEMMHSDGRKVHITNKKMTRTHFELLRAINEDNRPAMRAYIDNLAGRPAPTFEPQAPQSTGTSRATIADKYGKRMVDLMQENNRLQRARQAKSAAPIVRESGRNTIIKEGNRTTILRK